MVGLGHIAQVATLPAFAHARKNSRLAALVTGDPKKARALGRKYDIPVYGYADYQECLQQEDVQAAYIALPNDQHCEFTVDAARLGVHVLCEKPMALSEAECRRMIAACSDSEVRLMVAYRLHFEPANLALLEKITSGAIGEPRIFSSVFTMQSKAPNIRLERGHGGGPLWDIGIYCLNAARTVFKDEPEAIHCFTGRPPNPDPRFLEVEEAASVSIRFSGDRLANFVCSFGASGEGWYEVVGTEGSVKLENAYSYTGERVLTTTRKDKPRHRTFRQVDQFAPELLEFSRCVLEGRNPEPDGWEGLADVRAILAMHASAESGQPVKLPPYDRPRHPTPGQVRRKPPVQKPEEIHVSSPHH